MSLILGGWLIPPEHGGPQPPRGLLPVEREIIAATFYAALVTSLGGLLITFALDDLTQAVAFLVGLGLACYALRLMRWPSLSQTPRRG